MHKLAALPLTASLLLAAAVQADPVPQTPADWLARMGDFSANTLPLRSPENFVGFLHAATEPEFHQQRFDNLSEPAYWARTTGTLTSPAMPGNFTALATPQTAWAWAQAMMDPRFYEAMATVLGDQGKWMRWGAASLSPASYQPFFKPFDPQLQARWQAEAQTAANGMTHFNPPALSPAAATK